MPNALPLSPAGQTTLTPDTEPSARELFDELRARFEPVLSLALAMAARVGQQGQKEQESGDAQNALDDGQDYEALARAMNRLCDREERRPSRLGPRELGACRLAAYALADEILLGLPGSRWFAHGLQLQRLGRTDGGNVFYTTLDSMVREALIADTRDEDIVLLQPARKRTDAALEDLVQEVGDARDTAQAMARLASICDADAPNTALAASAFMAMCLLYGFRGRLYAEERAAELEDMLAASSGLVARFLPAAGKTTSALWGGPPARPGLRERLCARLRHPGPLFLVLFPVLVTALWYLTCTSIINSLDLPWLGR